MSRKYTVTVIPPSRMEMEFQIEVMPLSPNGAVSRRAYDNRRQLRIALGRLGIMDNMQEHVLEILSRGDRYHIIGVSIPDEIAGTFGVTPESTEFATEARGEVQPRF